MINTICGPCSCESRKMALDIAKELKRLGVEWFRGGLFKYRSNPADFQGIGYDGISILKEIRSMGLKTCVEIFNTQQCVLLKDCVDMYQIGSRNMYNTDLLKSLGAYGKPILFKRHYNASLQEFVNHSKYIEGEVIMCLRGVDGGKDIRFKHDFTDIPLLRKLTTNKICYDVSHSSCELDYVMPALKACQIYEPDHIMIESHTNPKGALSDPNQQVPLVDLERYIKEIK